MFASIAEVLLRQKEERRAVELVEEELQTCLELKLFLSRNIYRLPEEKLQKSLYIAKKRTGCRGQTGRMHGIRNDKNYFIEMLTRAEF